MNPYREYNQKHIFKRTQLGKIRSFYRKLLIKFYGTWKYRWLRCKYCGCIIRNQHSAEGRFFNDYYYYHINGECCQTWEQNPELLTLKFKLGTSID